MLDLPEERRVNCVHNRDVVYCSSIISLSFATPLYCSADAFGTTKVCIYLFFITRTQPSSSSALCSILFITLCRPMILN
jgi:hypothetical protein